MLYILEKHIENHEWGEAITFDEILPAKVNRINGLFAVVNIDPTTSIDSLTEMDFETGDDYILLKVKRSIPESNQVGICNISLNNTEIINIMPACIVKELHNSSFNHNMQNFAKPISIMDGSSIRLVFEEVETMPFTTKEKIETLIAEGERILEEERDPEQIPVRTAKETVYAAFGITDIKELTNGYTLKLYIDYD